jgi:nucleoside-diphosphate-sugar epimerase
MNSKLVLVTGGAGFIGSHLTDSLIALGYRVRIIDNLSQGQREWISGEAEFVEGDISRLEDCRRACRGVDGIFHLAAMSRVAPSLDDINSCTQPNVVGTQNILIAAREFGVQRLVYAGSSTYYGNQKAPQHEGMSPELLNYYSLSKYVGEQYCALFSRMYGLSISIVRYFNVYGPRQPETGAYALVIGIFLDRAKLGLPLVIHGDGTQRRDFVHVRDAAGATIRVFESDASGEVFNVGSGTNVSVQEIADLISPRQEYAARRAGDAEVTLADTSRIRARLGWQAQVRFEDGLRELIALAHLPEGALSDEAVPEGALPEKALKD